MDAKALFLEHLDLIDERCRSICRRNGVFDDDARDFAADVRLRLVEDDYAVVRKFQGRSSLPTYLTVVIGNLFRDYRIKRWGKWRPSAKARELGESAVILETLLYRDGRSLDETCRVIQTTTGGAVNGPAVRELAKRLPARTPRQVASDTPIDAVPGPDRANGHLLEQERAAEIDRARAALERVIASLPHEDHVVIRMRFYEGFSVADIARALGLEQRPLYDRIERDLRRLRAGLQADGIGPEVLELL